LDVATAAAAVVVKPPPLLYFLGGMMWVRVGKMTHKNCVSGPLFACHVLPQHAFSRKISQHCRVGLTCWRHVGDIPC
jgi:hypothetical protein